MAKNINRKVKSNKERKRMSVFKSLRDIYVQIIDDEKGVTLAAASSLKLEEKNKMKAAQLVGKAIAEAAKRAKVKMIVFDRGNYKYMGRIKALAEAAREGGLIF